MASTKLIHGGLRYLEHYEFKLVRHALIEREVLWRNAPHIIWPMRFVLPHRPGLRPAWMLRLGLFIYDHMGGRNLLPPTRTLRLASDPAGAPLKDVSHIAFEYSDCWVQDNRLVVLNARDAQARGAEIRVRTQCLGARRPGRFLARGTQRRGDGRGLSRHRPRAYNAAGPWVGEVNGEVVGSNDPARIRLVQGSHIVVSKLYDHERCYFFQNPDGRIFSPFPMRTISR